MRWIVLLLPGLCQGSASHAHPGHSTGAATAPLVTSAQDLRPGLYFDLGTDKLPGTFRTERFADTLGVRIFIDRDSLPKLEGVEFLVGYDCATDAACGVTRSLVVTSFQPDTALIVRPERITCDETCLCDSCFLPTHYRLHIRADRLSTLAANLRAPVGTLHIRTTPATRVAELHFELAYLWTFGNSPLEIRALDVRAQTNRARVGGVTGARTTRWGVLRLMYR